MRKNNKWERLKNYLLEESLQKVVYIPVPEVANFMIVVLGIYFAGSVIKAALPETDRLRWAINFILGLAAWYTIWHYTVERWAVRFRLFRVMLFGMLAYNIIYAIIKFPW